MVTEVEIKEIFNQYFEGDLNFVTPNVYGYDYFAYDKDNLVLFEKSTNDNGTLYGASALLFNPNSNICRRIDLSNCFYSDESLKKYIHTLDAVDFEEALQYGEDKRIVI